MQRFSQEYRQKVIDRLILITRMAITQEIVKKYPILKEQKKCLYVREYSTFSEFLCDQLAFIDFKLNEFIGKDNTFMEIMKFANEYADTLKNVLATIKMHIEGSVFNSMMYIIFGHLINLQNSMFNFRYLSQGETHKELKEFLKKCGIKHPDDVEI